MPAVTPDHLPALVAARRTAREQGGVVSRRQLYAVGVTRWLVRARARSGRWQLLGDQSVCLHNGPLTEVGHFWAAVFQGGPRACLDGAAALVAGGLQRYEVDRVRVSVPRGARVRRDGRYDIRQTRRWSADDVVCAGVPRTRPAVAAVRAALWARTDRQASYLLTATVQQGLTTAEDLGREALRIRRDRRRRLVHQVVEELLAGARTLDEAEIVRELVRRGLPPPRAVRSCAADRTAATTSTSTGPTTGSSSRSMGSSTPGSTTSWRTPSGRTTSCSPATACCACRCWGCAWSRTRSSAR